ncbi:MAG: hypothetical protein AAF639_44100 [Chloroflexota bacterium]
MSGETITLTVPEKIYRRLMHTAHATRRSIDEVALHALKLGIPPTWDEAPEEVRAELASMDQWDDDALWDVIYRRETMEEMARYDELLLLLRNQDGLLNPQEHAELERLRTAYHSFRLRKTHAADLLRWRGHNVPKSLADTQTT